MITKIYSAYVTALETHLVTVELLMRDGRQSFYFSGMIGSAAFECKNRLMAVLFQNNIDIKEVNLSINLTPSTIKKGGSSFDLPIMVAILMAVGKMKISEAFLRETIFIGELSYDGDIRSSDNIIPIILDAKRLGIRRVIIPPTDYDYDEFGTGVEVISMDSLYQLQQYLRGEHIPQKRAPQHFGHKIQRIVNDFGSVRGQSQIKRMLQISVAGDHNAIMVGPPGSGKTMLANCMPSLTSPMTMAEKMEVTRIYSSHTSFNYNLVQDRPFRSPHHTISTVGMTGGGSPIMPGELSLAHNGILFLDELTEFKRSVIENLRQPIESRTINISRASSTISLPCSFTLVASMNPCPCGNLGNSKKQCLCTPLAIYNYLSKISGPFLDRIDLQAFMHSVDTGHVDYKEHGWDSATLLEGVNRAKYKQFIRYGGDSRKNGFMTADDMDKYCILDDACKSFMKACYEKFSMSMRSYSKIIKVARTIADIAGEETIRIDHLKEALMYRGLEQKLTDLKQRL